MTPEVNTSIIKNRIGKGFSLHWHEFYEFEFAIKGNGIQVVNGVSYPFNAGSLIMLSPVDFHQILSPDSSLHVYNIRFTHNMIDNVFIDCIINRYSPHVRRFQGENYREVLNLFNDIERETSINDTYSRLSIKGAIDKLLTYIFRSPEFSVVGKRFTNPFRSPHVKKALFYIQNNFRDELTLGKVSSFVHLSPHYFSKLFHANTGYTFVEYLLDYRIKFAKSLLTGSNMSVTEIAYSSGFNSPTHFTRMFNKLTKMSPRKFRDAHSFRKKNPSQDM